MLGVTYNGPRQLQASSGHSLTQSLTDEHKCVVYISSVLLETKSVYMNCSRYIHEHMS